MISAFVLIEAQPDAISGLAPAIAEIDGVREAHSVAGSSCDVVAVLAVADHQAIAEVVTERIGKLDGIVSTQTLIAFRSYSSAEIAASFEGFGD